MKADAIKKIRNQLNSQIILLGSEQYKNGSYSRYGGDTTIRLLREIREVLDKAYEEEHEKELMEKVKKEFIENLAGIVIERY